MKKARMKGKTVDEAVAAALEVAGGSRENARINVLSEGKSGVLGIGSEEAEVEVLVREGKLEDAKQLLQEILDKMRFLAVAEGKEEEGRVELSIKGEDLGRIIGKEGATLRALEILLGSMLIRLYGERVGVGVDAGDYKEKRTKSLERLAREVAEEVAQTGKEKAMPHLDARDRRIVHMYLKEDPQVTSYSVGEGRERRLMVSPRG